MAGRHRPSGRADLTAIATDSAGTWLRLQADRVPARDSPVRVPVHTHRPRDHAQGMVIKTRARPGRVPLLLVDLSRDRLPVRDRDKQQDIAPSREAPGRLKPGQGRRVWPLGLAPALRCSSRAPAHQDLRGVPRVGRVLLTEDCVRMGRLEPDPGPDARAVPAERRRPEATPGVEGQRGVTIVQRMAEGPDTVPGPRACSGGPMEGRAGPR